ncbi:Nephrin [Eumeta japonica]|uniref:Nephrin n=1 Tax=Eumeta variegata TaxID=151549 RepID=A0A4C1TC65_EUMVA|nr:Nephrin [Eumeta japonica]
MRASSRDLRGKAKDVDEGQRRGRYRLVETKDMMYLQVARVRADDAGFYYCYADFSVSFAHKTSVHLIVISPPERLWVIQENGSIVGESISTANHELGPLRVGDHVRLMCVVFGGKPRPNLTWWTGGRVLKDTSMQLSERRMRSLLIYGPLSRKDHGRVLTCRAANNKYIDALSIDITLDVYYNQIRLDEANTPALIEGRSIIYPLSGSAGIYSRRDSPVMPTPSWNNNFCTDRFVSAVPPELVSLRGPPGAVRAGDAAALQCRVLGARPPPDVVWHLNGKQMPHIEQNIKIEASQRLVVSDVELIVTPELDEAPIMCCASAYDRHDSYICADNFTFSVTYPPILEIINEELHNDTLSVVMGSNVTLNCSISANPAIDNYFWYHEDEIIYDSNDTGHSIQLQPTLQLDSVEEKAAGEYRCGAVNAEGRNESQAVVVDVLYAPICTKDIIEKFGVGKESVRISCEVKANPEPISYRWVFFNGTNATDNENFTSELNSSAQVLDYNRPSDVIYGTILCWGLNGIPDLNGDADVPNKPCKFIITNETVPQSPKECKAVRNEQDDVAVRCEEGHNGGLPQVVGPLDQVVGPLNVRPSHAARSRLWSLLDNLSSAVIGSLSGYSGHKPGGRLDLPTSLFNVHVKLQIFMQVLLDLLKESQSYVLKGNNCVSKDRGSVRLRTLAL